MKVCKGCEKEIDTKDGENYCQACEERMANGKRPKRKSGGLSAKEKREILESLGLKRVRGALGGVYYE